MNSLLLYFIMFYLLKVPSAEMTVCKTVSSDNEPEYNQQSVIIIENNDLKKNKKETMKQKVKKVKRVKLAKKERKATFVK